MKMKNLKNILKNLILSHNHNKMETNNNNKLLKIFKINLFKLIVFKLNNK